MHSRPSQRRLPPLAHYSIGAVAHFYFGANSIETSTAAGRLVFHVFAALAEFERRLIVERTMAGLTAARARGRKGGRPGLPTEKIAAIQALAASGHSPAEVCKALGIGRSTFYKHTQSVQVSEGTSQTIKIPPR